MAPEQYWREGVGVQHQPRSGAGRNYGYDAAPGPPGRPGVQQYASFYEDDDESSFPKPYWREACTKIFHYK